MVKITNTQYREFLNKGIISTIEPEHLNTILTNLQSRHKTEATALIITAYLTGARPNEILQLKSHHIQTKGQNISIQLTGSKGGLPRTLFIPKKNTYAKILLQYAQTLPPNIFLFYHFRSNRVRITKNKKGHIKEQPVLSDRLYYHFKKWTTSIFPDGIPPYYFRHNTFSKLIMSDNITESDIKFLKGSKSLESVTPYLHLSKARSLKIGKHIK